MLINEKYIMLEARIEMWLQTQLDNDRIMMTVDVGVDAVETFEDLADEGGESFGEGDAWKWVFSVGRSWRGGERCGKGVGRVNYQCGLGT